jgi:hypothetical protein
MQRLLLAAVAMLTLAGCMNPNDPDAQTHCLIPAACLDLLANHDPNTAYWFDRIQPPTPAVVYAAPPPPMPQTFSYHCQNAGYSNVCTVNPY